MKFWIWILYVVVVFPANQGVNPYFFFRGGRWKLQLGDSGDLEKTKRQNDKVLRLYTSKIDVAQFRLFYE